MDLSAVLPTLSGQDRPATSLDALAEHAPDAEVVVANGPSADGTTGMVRERDDVDVLAEISDHDLDIAHSAGLEVVDDDMAALLRYDLSVKSSWPSALEVGIADGGVVIGPMHQTLRNGMTIGSFERNAVSDRTVTYFNGGNITPHRRTIDALDGLDEYLRTGGTCDAAHRLVGLNHSVARAPEMCVHRGLETDGGISGRGWGWKYRSLIYRLVKDYGIRPGIVKRVAAHTVPGDVDAVLDILRGDVTPSGQVGSVCDVVGGITTGVSDGLATRACGRTRTRDLHGRLRRVGRAVARYDRR